MDDAFWGRRSIICDLTSTTCKGNWIAARHHYVLERHGEQGVEHVAGLLESPYREAFLAPPLPFVWLPLDLLAHIDHAIFSGPMHGDMGQMRAFGGFIARRDLTAIYRMFLKLGTPGFVLGRSRLIFGQYVKGGSLEPTVDGNEATFVLRDLVVPYYLCEHGILGWLQAAIELARGHDVQVTQPKCAHRGDAECVLHASWR